MNELLKLNYWVVIESQDAKYPLEKWCQVFIFAIKILSNISVISKCPDSWVMWAKWLIIDWTFHFHWVYFEIVQPESLLRTQWRRKVGGAIPRATLDCPRSSGYKQSFNVTTAIAGSQWRNHFRGSIFRVHHNKRELWSSPRPLSHSF